LRISYILHAYYDSLGLKKIIALHYANDLSKSSLD